MSQIGKLKMGLLIGIKMKTWSAYATCVGRDISIVQGIDIRMGVIVTN